MQARRLAVRCCQSVAIAAVLVSIAPLRGLAADRVPGKSWELAERPDDAGWSSSRLEAVADRAREIESAAIVVVHEGMIVWQWGETDRPFMCHSMRKSLLSALYGRHVEEGRIDLDATLGELGIDDREPSLTESEKLATVEMLLEARSGVYHPALYETAGMKARRPARGLHPPGTFWYYNNWDFNALGTIFENRTGRSIYEEFDDRIARPLGMQDFVRDEHTGYVTGPDSVHPAYPFQLSARDLARFGLLCCRGGSWGGQQLLSRLWLRMSTRACSDAGDAGGYGYMWWVAVDGRHLPGVSLPAGSYSARGYRGHHILVIPRWDVVVVHRVDTFLPDGRVTAEEFGSLIALLVEARPPGLLLPRVTL